MCKVCPLEVATGVSLPDPENLKTHKVFKPIQDLNKQRVVFLRVTLCALTLLDPGGEGLLEVFVLLECDRTAHLGGQHHLGSGGALAGNGADDNFGRGGGRGGSPGRRGCDGAGLLFETFLQRGDQTLSRRNTRTYRKEYLARKSEILIGELCLEPIRKHI